MKNPKKTIATALLIILAFSAISAIMLQSTKATVGVNIPTYAYVIVAPDPVGLGQTVNVGFWLDKVPPTAYEYYGDRWEKLTVTVTKPDGTTENLGPFTSDDTGGTNTPYTPTQTGNYTFVLNFPGQTIAGSNPSPLTGTYNAASVGNYYQPSTSDKYILKVQQDPIPT